MIDAARVWEAKEVRGGRAGWTAPWTTPWATRLDLLTSVQKAEYSESLTEMAYSSQGIPNYLAQCTREIVL